MSYQIDALEQQLSNAKQVAKRGQQALKLASNKDFREVVLEFFCTESCARYAQESADPALSPENRADALAMAQAAGHLKRFLSYQIQMGRTAESEIISIEMALDEARQEEASGEGE